MEKVALQRRLAASQVTLPKPSGKQTAAPETAHIHSTASWNPQRTFAVFGTAVANFWRKSCSYGFCRFLTGVLKVWQFWSTFLVLIVSTPCSWLDACKRVRVSGSQSFACLCGWKIHLAKSLFPSKSFRALGAWFHLSPWPKALLHDIH